MDPLRRPMLLAWLVAPLLAVPLLAWALMEYAPERSFIFAIYLLVWGIAFLVAGLVLAKRGPAASVGAVLAVAAAWATGLLLAAVAALFAFSFMLVP